jgi:hypothetical protein
MVELKRIKMIAISMLVLCSSLLLISIGTTMASEAGYTFTEYYMGTAVTADGRITSPDEWQDVTTQSIAPNVHWAYKMDTTDFTMTWIIEFADRTNDAGDRWQICLDGSNDGGTAPNTNDVKIEIEGHTTLKGYVGTGTAWAAATVVATFADSITTSANDPALHYIVEIKFSKSQWADWGGNPPPHGVRVACYDASNAAAGWQAWPPTTDTNPSRWGLIADYTASPAPEGLTIGVMALLSSVAVLVSTRYFRKRP